MAPLGAPARAVEVARARCARVGAPLPAVALEALECGEPDDALGMALAAAALAEAGVCAAAHHAAQLRLQAGALLPRLDGLAEHLGEGGASEAARALRDGRLAPQRLGGAGEEEEEPLLLGIAELRRLGAAVHQAAELVERAARRLVAEAQSLELAACVKAELMLAWRAVGQVVVPLGRVCDAERLADEARERARAAVASACAHDWAAYRGHAARARAALGELGAMTAACAPAPAPAPAAPAGGGGGDVDMADGGAAGAAAARALEARVGRLEGEVAGRAAKDAAAVDRMLRVGMQQVLREVVSAIQPPAAL